MFLVHFSSSLVLQKLIHLLREATLDKGNCKQGLCQPLYQQNGNGANCNAPFFQKEGGSVKTKREVSLVRARGYMEVPNQ